jgi:hypothetical protein
LTGDAVATGLIFGFAIIALFWLVGIAFHPAKPRSKERALLFVFAAAFLAAMKWFWP